jgi:hypothetical protein
MSSAQSLSPLAPGVWGYDYELIMPGGVEFPVRPVVIVLPDGGVWIVSPGPISDALAAQIEALGPVRHLVSPNTYHHLHLGDAARRWPEAKVWAPEGLQKKRPELRIDATLSAEAEVAWGGAIQLLLMEGAPALNEWVFFHRPSRALLVTDLVFNIQSWRSAMSSFVFWMMGVNEHKLAQSRAWRWFLAKDRAALARSAQAVVALDAALLVPSHGAVIERDVKAELSRAMAWMLAG